MPPRFADADSPSRPLHVLASADLPDWLAGQGDALRGWVQAAGFTAALGEVVLLPGADGVAGAVFGFGTAEARARGRFPLARAVAASPDGDWHLVADLSAADRDEAALGWLLAQYRFDRYHAAKAPGARLKAPEGCDAARIEAIAAGECLTRDLINTPASDLGPAELEEAFLSLARQHGAETVVIRGDDLLTQNFPMIHAVGRASDRAPRLLEMRWGTAGPSLTLVGKGVWRLWPCR